MVDRLLARQSGLVSLRQLLDLGVSRETVRSRLRTGVWRLVLPRVIADSPRPLDGHRRLIAAQLLAGPDAVVASVTAAAWHGVRTADFERRVRMQVPHERFVRGQAFVVITRTRRPDPQPVHAAAALIAAPARAVADAARDVGGDRARAIVIEAVQRSIATLPELRHELEIGPRRGSAALRKALGDAEAGAWSIPEADLASLCTTSRRLPAVWLNPCLTTPSGLRLPTPDVWFDDVGLAVQVHSRRYHADELDWEATVSADGVFAEHGVPLVAVTPRQIAVESAAVLQRIERAYAHAAMRPRPQVVASPRRGV